MTNEPHTPVLHAPPGEESGTVQGPTIIGCACGWKPPLAGMDADDAFAFHVAAMTPSAPQSSKPALEVCAKCGWYTHGPYQPDRCDPELGVRFDVLFAAVPNTPSTKLGYGTGNGVFELDEQMHVMFEPRGEGFHLRNVWVLDTLSQWDAAELVQALVDWRERFDRRKQFPDTTWWKIVRKSNYDHEDHRGDQWVVASNIRSAEQAKDMCAALNEHEHEHSDDYYVVWPMMKPLQKDWEP